LFRDLIARNVAEIHAVALMQRALAKAGLVLPAVI
jgi:hypothetical protein